ncbi:hypothetical protein RD110_18700 [Rhodoferax koreense]|uniref:Virulence-associated protein E-like domain-containing protein n=1 Tax=Rhodoferax koreensis TaxID=1842727 RepID=A0A1P8JZ07_9BURK|nr:hypothetical protein RD110_18700 [Rhodoferax koreense]
MWDSIPASLAARQQWLLWRFEQKEGKDKPQKIPYYVGGGRRTGGQGDDRDRQRLATLAVARRAFERPGSNWAGVGFALLPDDGLIGIDLDGQIDPGTGEISERCQNIVKAFASYTEFSPSGKGVHILVEGQTNINKSDDIGVEIFCGSQYFTFTGNHWPDTPAEVAPVDELALRRLHKTVDEAKAARKAAKSAKPVKAAPAPASRPAAESGAELFAQVNREALRAMASWVPELFPKATTAPGGYRVTSKDLNRKLQEDLSIHADGIQDWGEEQGYTPIDLVMKWLPASKSGDAMRWLAQRVGVDVPKPDRTPKKKNRDQGAPAGGDQGAGPDGGGDDDGKGDGRWREGEVVNVLDMLVMARGNPLDCRENVLYCMTHDPELRGLVRRNDFTLLLERSRTTPWGREDGEWDEEDDLMLGEYLMRTYRLGVKSKGTLRDGVMMAARLFRYNPVVDWIKAETWDGVDRLEHWLTDVFEVEERPYTRLIGKCFMLGLVQRAIQPGCKFDYMLILKGAQGLSKSGAFRALAYPYFTDNAIRIGDKDSQMAQQLAWIVESAELESLNKSESTLVKQHLSAQEDWYRPPYGSAMKKAPRHSVSVGTTNAETFLKDATGDRRMWPLEVHVVHLDVLTAMRAQLLAEALHRLNAGEQTFPSRQEEKDLVFPEHEQFRRGDPWEYYLDEYVNADVQIGPTDVLRSSRDFFATTELYDKALSVKADRIDGNGQMDTRLGNAMKTLGFERHRQKTGKRLRGWLRLSMKSTAVESSPAPADGWIDPAGEADDLPF